MRQQRTHSTECLSFLKRIHKRRSCHGERKTEKQTEKGAYHHWHYHFGDRNRHFYAETHNTQHTIISANVFDKLGNDRSVGEWIFDAVNGDVKTYGIELLDKTF